MSNRLLPSGSSALELAAAEACAELARVDVPLKTLWDPQTCPAKFLPYLAWALSVDRWDSEWPTSTKRSVIQSAWFIHQHKGTISAIKRVVEPLGYVIKVTEWWETDDPPGTFKLDIGVLDSGIDEAMYQEMERLLMMQNPPADI